MGKLIATNVLWAGWTAATFSECLTWGLGVIGAITLIWLNIEGIIPHRNNRKKCNKHKSEDRVVIKHIIIYEV